MMQGIAALQRAALLQDHEEQLSMLKEKLVETHYQVEAAWPKGKGKPPVPCLDSSLLAHE